MATRSLDLTNTPMAISTPLALADDVTYTLQNIGQRPVMLLELSDTSPVPDANTDANIIPPMNFPFINIAPAADMTLYAWGGSTIVVNEAV